MRTERWLAAVRFGRTGMARIVRTAGLAAFALAMPLLPVEMAGAQQAAYSPEVTGRWIGGFENRATGEVPNSFELALRVEGGKLTGSITDLSPMSRAAAQPIDEGLITGANISFLLKGTWNNQFCTGEVKGDRLILTRQNDRGNSLPSFVLTRFFL